MRGPSTAKRTLDPFPLGDASSFPRNCVQLILLRETKKSCSQAGRPLELRTVHSSETAHIISLTPPYWSFSLKTTSRFKQSQFPPLNSNRPQASQHNLSSRLTSDVKYYMCPMLPPCFRDISYIDCGAGRLTYSYFSVYFILLYFIFTSHYSHHVHICTLLTSLT